MMNKIAIFVFLFIAGLLTFQCSRNEATVFVTGDEASIGAEVYIDGVKVAEMAEQIYYGPESDVMKTGDKFAVAVAIDIIKEKTAAKYGFYDQPRVSQGPHQIRLISTDGVVLEKQITIRAENYLAVDFSKKEIRGGE